MLHIPSRREAVVIDTGGESLALDGDRGLLAGALTNAVAALPWEPALAVLTDGPSESVPRWESACRLAGLQFDRIDLTSAGWLERIGNRPYDYLLLRLHSRLSLIKQLIDERVAILDSLGYAVYPTRLEVELYENKRLLSYWLRGNEIPHPPTRVFYRLEEARAYLTSCRLPVVGKSIIGAAGSGVVVLRTRRAAERYARNAFSQDGLHRRFGPNLKQGNLARRGGQLLRSPAKLLRKWKSYLAVHGDVQRGFVLIQDYVQHAFEWRVVKIGDSYFAHKKIVHKGTASGSKRKEYGEPPLKLLDFVRELCDAHHLTSQAVDVFETAEGEFLVNELQTSFGQSDPHQMIIDGIPGRYRYETAGWTFEPGSFTTNECYDLRLLDVLHRLSERADGPAPSVLGVNRCGCS